MKVRHICTVFLVFVLLLSLFSACSVTNTHETSTLSNDKTSPSNSGTVLPRPTDNSHLFETEPCQTDPSSPETLPIQTDPSSPETLPIQTDPSSTSPDYADESKICDDLLATNANVFVINNQYTYLGIDSIEILRRKSTSDYDEIHIAVEYCDSFYVVSTEYILYYSYYNIGGWCLDSYQITTYNCKATDCPVTDSDFISFMKNHFSSCIITERSSSIDLDGVYTDIIYFASTLEYSYLTVNLSGYYILEFYDSCWQESYDFWIDTYDWSALEGAFRYRNQNFNMGAGFYSAEVNISLSNIEQASQDKLQLTYSADVYLYDKTGGYVDTNEEIVNKSKTLTISYESMSILGKEIQIPTKARYITLPWYGTFAVFLCRDNGVEATDDTKYGFTFAHFDKIPLDEELQDAFDKLKGSNP